MSEPLDHRVTKLEYRVDGLETTQKAMSETLNSIKQNLTQIKWVVVGASGALALKSLDVGSLLKLLLHAF